MKTINKLKKHILVDGFHIVVDTEKSHGSWIVDAETGKEYLDCYSQFASQALGWNHPSLKEKSDYINRVTLHKLANSDMYSHTYGEFVETFASTSPDFAYHFFIDGGALAVENALKAAFDWKCQVSSHHQQTDGQDLDIIHLKEAFHGRSGYTLSLTNTGDLKTKWFPKFPWTRLINPKIHFKNQTPINEEKICLNHMEMALKIGNVAAIIFETIQGEGGDNYFRPEFFQAVRDLATRYNALFILDEVQTGMGLTGKWWAYEHYGIIPDLITFGKKSQVCGFASTRRIDYAPNNVFKQSGRINSTWGGNIVDMARSKLIIDIIKEEKLLDNATVVGNYFLEQLRNNFDNSIISNIRGKGLMIAFDLPSTQERDNIYVKLRETMFVLKCGEQSLRFRPALTFSTEDVDMVVGFIRKVID